MGKVSGGPKRWTGTRSKDEGESVTGVSKECKLSALQVSENLDLLGQRVQEAKDASLIVWVQLAESDNVRI